MGFGQKYKRIGTFVIDLSIVSMFARIAQEIYVGILAYLAHGTGVSISLESNLALPSLILFIIGIMFVTIGVFVGYHWICYRFLGNSLSRYFLRLSVESDDDSPMTKQRYLRREFYKIYLTVATLGLYAFYNGAQYVAFGYKPLHDKKFATKVVEY